MSKTKPTAVPAARGRTHSWWAESSVRLAQHRDSSALKTAAMPNRWLTEGATRAGRR